MPVRERDDGWHRGPVSNEHIEVRPLREDDVENAEEFGFSVLAEAGPRFGYDMGVRSDDRVAAGRTRVRHLLATDPHGLFAAERDGSVVGLAMSLRREQLWFLSLLVVRPDLQGSGIGRRLLEVALDYGETCSTGMICSSPDPKALRRYARAGFALEPAFAADGTAVRGRLPADLGVREGDWARDADLVDDLVRACRGAGYGPDLGLARDVGARLLVREGSAPGDRAVAVSAGGGIGPVAGASPEAAARVLCATVAESDDPVRLGYLTGAQQWAIEVALEVGLSLHGSGALCLRGFPGTPTPYLPNGMLG